MSEKIFKCVVCGGNANLCILAVSSTSNFSADPTQCPFSIDKPKWEEVKE